MVKTFTQECKKETWELLMDENTINPSKEIDLSICPHCKNETFYKTDYGREFCAKCRKEVRVNKNFKGGKLID